MEKKLVVITGASSGIGKSCAELFNKHGYPLLLMSRRIEILNSYNFKNCLCVKVDVKNFEEIRMAIELAEQKFGKTDLLINNAGVMFLDEVIKSSIEDDYNMIDTNIKGVINGVRSVLPSMQENKHGTIINVSSVAGRWSYPNRCVYSATKSAVHMYSLGLRKELAPDNIRVTVIAPAIVDTNLLVNVKNKQILDDYKHAKDLINQGMTALEVAELIKYTYELPQHICLKEIVCSHTNQVI